MTTKNKKAQHETIGFVLIIVIVVVIGLVVLMLSINKPSGKTASSLELSNLLEASMISTSDCALDFIPDYQGVEQLIKECYKTPGKKCLNEKNVCDSLKTSLENNIKTGLNVNENKPNKAFKLSMVDSQNKTLLEIKQGNFVDCRQVLGASYSKYISGVGEIGSRLELCKGK